MNVAIVAGNVEAIFRLGVMHVFCSGGDFMYGQQLILKIAIKGLDRAICVGSLMLAFHTYPSNLNSYGFTKTLWSSIYDEKRINMIRLKLSQWFPLLNERLEEGPIFQVHPYSCCSSQSHRDRMSWICKKCRIDIEI